MIPKTLFESQLEMYNDFDIFEKVMSPDPVKNAKSNYKAHFQKRFLVFFAVFAFKNFSAKWVSMTFKIFYPKLKICT